MEKLINGYFIPGNVPSLKNSKMIVGKRLIKSKSCMEYEKNYSSYYSTLEVKNLLKDQAKPIKLGMYFIRKSRHVFDYINAAQEPLDLLVKSGIIPDDNADEIIPVFLGYHHDKENPGLIIKVL